MKKIALSAFVAATLVSATDFNYEITPVAGYLWNFEAGDKTPTAMQGPIGGIQNHSVYGLEMQANKLDLLGIKPELSVLYGRDTVEGQDFTGVLTTMINGLYELETGSFVTPFAKAGMGYEWYTNTHPTDFNGIIVDAGMGLKADLTKHIALKLEGLYFYKQNNGDSAGSEGGVHNVAALAGLTFSFDEKTAPVAAVVVAEKPKPAPVVVAEKPKPTPVIATPVVAAPVVVTAPMDSDKDGVIDAQDTCSASPAGFAVDAKGCNLDADKDGVLDPADKCSKTPSGYKVDANGCVLSFELRLNFPTNSSVIPASDAKKVKDFTTFMKDNTEYKAEIVGYTDSAGKDAYNQKLSEKRAQALKDAAVKDGVTADRITTIGKGELDPIASNATKEGRAENRRLQVTFTK